MIVNSIVSKMKKRLSFSFNLVFLLILIVTAISTFGQQPVKVYEGTEVIPT